MTKSQIKQRLEYLRGEIKAERISYGEISELQDLAKYIEPGDVLLLEWAGVPEFPEEEQPRKETNNMSETTEKKYLACLPFFSGFYESLWSWAIDRHEEMEAEHKAELESSQEYEPETYQPEHLRISASEYAELFFRCCDYQKTYLKVAQFWVEAFDNWCEEYLGTQPKSFTWESMVSPREYNFTTDRVFAYVPASVVEMLFLRSAKEEHKTLAQVIKDTCTSYDGFWSHYSNDLESWLEKPLEEWDHNEIGALIRAAIESSDEWEDRGKFEDQLYEWVFSGNGEEDEAWAVDWPKFEEKVKELRAKKAAEHEETKIEN